MREALVTSPNVPRCSLRPDAMVRAGSIGMSGLLFLSNEAHIPLLLNFFSVGKSCLAVIRVYGGVRHCISKHSIPRMSYVFSFKYFFSPAVVNG